MSLLQDLCSGLPQGSGFVGLLSGDEFQDPVRGFDERLIELTGARIALVFDADHRAERHSARLATAHFRALGAEPVVADMHGPSRELPDFDVMYVAGGSPADLLGCLRGNPTWAEVMDRWRRGASLVGASAGAMALCEHCLTPKEGDHVPTVWSEGIGPVKGVGLAVHASSRAQRWIEQIARNAPCPVLALGDHTGVILAHNAAPEVIGPSRVWEVSART